MSIYIIESVYYTETLEVVLRGVSTRVRDWPHVNYH